MMSVLQLISILYFVFLLQPFSTYAYDDDDFLRAIVEDPESDTPRLIYADRLDERDDARHEYIRISVELEKLDRQDPKYDKLKFRQSELFNQIGINNLLPKTLRGLVVRGNSIFKRGFVHSLSLRPEEVIENFDKIFSDTSTIREVDLFFSGSNSDTFTNFQFLLKQEKFLKLKTLGLSSITRPIDAESIIDILVNTKNFGNIEGLEFYSTTYLTGTSISNILRNEKLIHLKKLDFWQMSETNLIIDALLDSKIKLKSIELSLSDISERDLIRFVNSDAAQTLEYLGIAFYSPPLTQAVWQAISGSSKLKNLKAIKMTNSLLLQPPKEAAPYILNLNARGIKFTDDFPEQVQNTLSLCEKLILDPT